jgi:uncharacterized protein (DUF697 family)
MSLPVRLSVLRALVEEVSAADTGPLVVSGARELAPVLRRELALNAAAGAVPESDDPSGAAVVLHVLAGAPTAEDEEALKRARRARVPVLVVATAPLPDDVTLPYVLATDVVPVPAGASFPLEEIAAAVAARLGEEAAPLAARVPVLRRAVADRIVATFSRRSGGVAAAVFVPGADLPVIALNQVRMLLRLEQAYGLEIDRDRVPEVLATVGAGFGLRALARELLDLVPGPGWLVKGAVAYGGTRALGEAALRRLEARPV